MNRLGSQRLALPSLQVGEGIERVRCRAMAMSRSRTPASLSAAGRSIGLIPRSRPGINDVSTGKSGSGAAGSGFGSAAGSGRAVGNGVPADESSSVIEDEGTVAPAVGGGERSETRRVGTRSTETRGQSQAASSATDSPRTFATARKTEL